MLYFNDFSEDEFIFIMDFFGTLSNFEHFLIENNLTVSSLLKAMRLAKAQVNYERYLKVTKQK